MVQNDSNELQAEVRELAEEIATYLRERPQVADTVEGIARWWIMRQRLQESERRVALAMEYLCDQGVVNARQLPDGELLYSARLSDASVNAAATVHPPAQGNNRNIDEE